MAVDTDRLLRRRLYLQRYATSLAREVAGALEAGDARLERALSAFLAEAPERARVALGRQDESEGAARAILLALRAHIAEQQRAAEGTLGRALPELAAREAAVTGAAIESEAPVSTRGVEAQPVGGETPAAIVGALFLAYGRRLIGEVTLAAAERPEDLVRVVRGTRAERFRDGVLHWRNELAIAPGVNRIVNGVATNAAFAAYEAAGEDEVDWLATLDFRTCPTCFAREAEGPYPIARAPRSPAHPHCLTGDAHVSAGSRITAVSERWYEGDVIIIRTAGGKDLTCTPNHPILTDRGFLPASSLHVGGHVVRERVVERGAPRADHDRQEVPVPIEDLTRSLRSARGVASVEVPTTAEHFHGDGGASEVAVVSSYRFLRHRLDAAFGEQHTQPPLVLGRHGGSLLASLRGLLQALLGGRHSPHGIVRSLELPGALSLAHLRPFQCFCGALSPAGHAVPGEDARHDVPRDSVPLGDLVLGLAGEVAANDLRLRQREPALQAGSSSVPRDARGNEALTDELGIDPELARKVLAGLHAGSVFTDEVAAVEVRRFAGHVYNIETEEGHYAANGIVNHNCRCTIVPARRGERPARPFVKDDRPVSEIPKSERAGKIGQTRDTIEEFFARMTREQRRDYMGPSRAALFERGKLTDFRALVNERTKLPLTLDELPD